MKIDVTQSVLDLFGQPIEVSKRKQPGMRQCPTCGQTVIVMEDLTLRKAMIQALTSFEQEDKNGPEKFERYQIASKIAKSDEPDLTSEERAKIKRLIGRIYGPVVVGPCYDMIEKSGEKEGVEDD